MDALSRSGLSKVVRNAVLVGTGTMDIVFVMFCLCLKMVVNSCARGCGHHGHNSACHVFMLFTASCLSCVYVVHKCL